jgi:hypothetical protein
MPSAKKPSRISSLGYVEKNKTVGSGEVKQAQQGWNTASTSSLAKLDTKSVGNTAQMHSGNKTTSAYPTFGGNTPA